MIVASCGRCHKAHVGLGVKLVVIMRRYDNLLGFRRREVLPHDFRGGTLQPEVLQHQQVLVCLRLTENIFHLVDALTLVPEVRWVVVM